MPEIEFGHTNEDFNELVSEFWTVFPIVRELREDISDPAWFDVAVAVFGPQAVATFLAWEVKSKRELD